MLHKYTDFWRYIDFNFSNESNCHCFHFNKLGVILHFRLKVIQLAIAIPYLLFICITFDNKKSYLVGSKFGFSLNQMFTVFANQKQYAFDLINTLLGRETITVSHVTKYDILSRYELGNHKTSLVVEVYNLIKKRSFIQLAKQRMYKITLVEPIMKDGAILSEFTYGSTDLETALYQLNNYVESLLSVNV